MSDDIKNMVMERITNTSPTPLDTGLVCELLIIFSDSPIRRTCHYPLYGVGRHEDEEGSKARVETNSKKHGQGPNMANSFVARLISLTARNEIRYEGIWCSVDNENDNIALRNGVLL